MPPSSVWPDAPPSCRCAGCVQHGTSPEDGPILVTGASGGVGSAAVALLASAGFEVVASSGKTTEHDYLEGLGAARVVGRQFVEDDGRTLGPQLWAGVVDCVGGTALAEALRTVRYGGAVAASGLTGGNDLATTVYPFIVRGVALLGIDTVATPIEERRALWTDMADSFPLEHCEDMVNEEIGLDGLTAALDRVLDAAVRGRILVNPGTPAGSSGPRRRATPGWSRCCRGRWPDANVGEAIVAPGIVTVAVSEVGQLVSAPTGTSENW